jgi:hypothetical protein
MISRNSAIRIKPGLSAVLEAFGASKQEAGRRNFECVFLQLSRWISGSLKIIPNRRF